MICSIEIMQKGHAKRTVLFANLKEPGCAQLLKAAKELGQTTKNTAELLESEDNENHLAGSILCHMT
jgi:hypothetical protein